MSGQQVAYASEANRSERTGSDALRQALVSQGSRYSLPKLGCCSGISLSFLKKRCTENDMVFGVSEMVVEGGAGKVYSRLQKVGIWISGDLCCLSSFLLFSEIRGRSCHNFLASTALLMVKFLQDPKLYMPYC